MKKAPLYSRSRRPGVPEALPDAADGAVPEPPAAATPGRWARLRQAAGRHERRLWMVALVLLVALGWAWRSGPAVRAPLTFEQIDHLVRQSIEEKPLTSAAARAYGKVIPSVVRVVGYARDDDDDERPNAKGRKEPAPKADTGKDGAKAPKDAGKDSGKDAAKEPEMKERGVGTGVVIIDNGTILTNLHVVLGADKVKVTFHDGLESDARLVSVMPEHDLAVLSARRIPDDLAAATMRGTGDLNPGDRVLAIGFPFGIGPSASEGVVSGLKREFRSPEGDRLLTNLIQFDAAANPGNSGGPLVTMEGEVVGIVTAILNPTKQRVFVGIGFAVPIENAAAGAGMPPF
ncbi:MAG: trypsin-like peptidase domain-containing protein [Piscinibacter sp.]|nr:trypsin-like peptidase domain-containing protein [Piscinibacter sp.]